MGRLRPHVSEHKSTPAVICAIIREEQTCSAKQQAPRGHHGHRPSPPDPGSGCRGGGRADSVGLGAPCSAPRERQPLAGSTECPRRPPPAGSRLRTNCSEDRTGVRTCSSPAGQPLAPRHRPASAPTGNVHLGSVVPQTRQAKRRDGIRVPVGPGRSDLVLLAAPVPQGIWEQTLPSRGLEVTHHRLIRKRCRRCAQPDPRAHCLDPVPVSARTAPLSSLRWPESTPGHRPHHTSAHGNGDPRPHCRHRPHPQGNREPTEGPSSPCPRASSQLRGPGRGRRPGGTAGPQHCQACRSACSRL